MRIACYLFICLLINNCNYPKTPDCSKDSWDIEYAKLDMMDIQSNTHAFDKQIEAAKECNDKQYLLELKILRFHANKDRYTGNSALETQLTDWLEEAKSNKWSTTEAELYHQLALYHFFAHNDIKNSLIYFNKAYNIYKDLPETLFPQKCSRLFDFGNMYYRVENYEKSLDLHRKAAQCNFYNKSTIISANNSIAITYRNLNKLDSTLKYLRIALQIADTIKSTEWKNIINGNIGGVYFLKKEYAKAKLYFLDDLERGLKHNDFQTCANIYKDLAIIKLYDNQVDSAKYLCQLAEAYASKVDNLNIKISQQIYATYKTIYSKERNYAKALAYADSMTLLNDSIAKFDLDKSLLKAQEAIDAENYQKQLDSKVKFNTYFRNFLLLAIVLATALFLLALNRQKILVEKNKMRVEKAEEELHSAEEKLNGFKKMLEEKNQLLEHISEIKGEENVNDAKYEHIAQMEKSILLTDDQWNEFTILFEKVHGNFLQRLKVRLPSLSPAETRLIALSKLNLSNKAMASMLGVTPDAIRMNKHRLKKKISDGDSFDFDLFLEQI